MEIWGSSDFYVKENNTDIPYYNGNVEKNIDALKDVTSNKTELKKYSCEYDLKELIQKVQNKLQPAKGTSIGGTLRNKKKKKKTIKGGVKPMTLKERKEEDQSRKETLVKREVQNFLLDKVVELLKKKQTDVIPKESIIQAINQYFNFPGPNLINQPSEKLCVKLTLEYIPDINLTLPTPDTLSYPLDKGSEKLIGSYNMSFANLTDIVKYATGHFSSEAAFLAKQPNESTPRYKENAMNQLKSFMRLNPMAVSLQEMVVHSFQDELSKDEPTHKNMEIELLRSSAKHVLDEEGKHITVDGKEFPVFSFPVESNNPLTQTIPTYLNTIVKNYEDAYDITYGTVVAGNVGESSVILTKKGVEIKEPRIYNIGHNELVTVKDSNGKVKIDGNGNIEKVQKGTDARPVLIAKYGDVLLVNLHAPNKPQVTNPTKYIKDNTCWIGYTCRCYWFRY
jgi:hypothetical protein